MYIEKLTDKDLKDIFTLLVGFVENRKDEQQIASYFSKAKIHKYDGGLAITFSTELDKNELIISDYHAFMNYGFASEKIKVAYRKYMYNKFGNEYYNDMRDFYKLHIMRECDRKLENLARELNEVIK